MSARYYIYISDSKVDMLLPQIDPGFASKRSTEVGVNLQLLTGKHKRDSDPDRVSRLERVVRHIDDFLDVGTIDEPGQYFRGRLDVRWQQMPGFEYFAGATEDTVVGLGGSSGHVIGGAVPKDDAVIAPSMLPGMVRGLSALAADDAPASALELAYLANRNARGEEQEVEFVAKRLRHGPSPYPELDGGRAVQVLVGSPLFVALAE
ncbi:SAVMC3_10250 family protein [Amycolatopsis sp. SID8362]|uniref:DUF7019 family protein n=1 Tax=Amycolatopsis sp. SID8362 TaxID=2690346 RepID=UPI0013711D3D|nr:SAVMC3_10250 family protein [Amycolatopsis sp. SID8362]NBH02912.1 hypothetical protein [Amycolatopsis sp. SID8362]NED39613.1 hypothetical protein [Amycolatopsis sp. SID8362]